MNQLRILIVDDHPVVRQSLNLYLNEVYPLAHVAEAGGGHQALEMIAADLPDIVLMDMAMPHLDGEEATRQIKARWPELKVVALVLNWRQGELALNAGADAFVLKGWTSQEDLLRTISATLGLKGAGRSTAPATEGEIGRGP